MEADNLAVSEVSSSSKSHMQTLSCIEGGELSQGAKTLVDTFQQQSTHLYLLQVLAVNTTCLAWLQQQMQMVGVVWRLLNIASVLCMHNTYCGLCSWLQIQLTQQSGLSQSGMLQSTCP